MLEAEEKNIYKKMWEELESIGCDDDCEHFCINYYTMQEIKKKYGLINDGSPSKEDETI